MKKKQKQGIIFFKPSGEAFKKMPLAQNGVSAGFPSPADDFKEIRISIDQEVVKNAEATLLWCTGCKVSWYSRNSHQ